MSNAINSHYYSGQGVVMMGLYDPATKKVSALRPIGNVNALGIQVATTKLEHKESQTGARGIDKTITQEVNATVSITIEHLIAENLALGLYGTANKVAAGTETGVEETITPGTITPLGHIKVSAVVVKNAATPATVYEPDKNYVLNSEAGSIRWLSAAEQTALAATVVLADDADVEVTIDYAYAAQIKTEALTTAAPVRYLRFEGLNTAEDNQPVVVEIWKFESSPLADYALINEDISNIAIEGKALLEVSRPDGESKYFRQISLK